MNRLIFTIGCSKSLPLQIFNKGTFMNLVAFTFIVFEPLLGHVAPSPQGTWLSIYNNLL